MERPALPAPAPCRISGMRPVWLHAPLDPSNRRIQQWAFFPRAQRAALARARVRGHVRRVPAWPPLGTFQDFLQTLRGSAGCRNSKSVRYKCSFRRRVRARHSCHRWDRSCQFILFSDNDTSDVKFRSLLVLWISSAEIFPSDLKLVFIDLSARIPLAQDFQRRVRRSFPAFAKKPTNTHDEAD